MAMWEEFLGKPIRRYIETVFSRLTSTFPKKIHAVTPRGSELKIVWFLVAFAIHSAYKRQLGLITGSVMYGEAQQ
jgi:hypothetical protein